MAPLTSTTDTSINDTNLPTVRKVGTYQILPSPEVNGDWRAFVYRNGSFVTQARASTKAGAVLEARRNVRNARKCGGL